MSGLPQALSRLPAVSNSSTAGAAEQHSAVPFATASSSRSRGRLSTQMWSSLSTNSPVMPPRVQWFGSGFGQSESYLYFGGPSAAGAAVPTTDRQQRPAMAAVSLRKAFAFERIGNPPGWNPAENAVRRENTELFGLKQQIQQYCRNIDWG